MSRETFGRYAWMFVAYLLAVILFGAWVRIAGAGAGCGNHWPLCNGEVLPQSPQEKTVIEFTHRVTSALCGVFALLFVYWARRIGGARVLRFAWLTLFFVLVEGFIGAVLVKQELVAGDASVSRAIVVGLHLANTLLLTASAAAMALAVAPPPSPPALNTGRAMLAAMLGALLITNMTGAVTALGDTLFPVRPAVDGSLWARLGEDISSGQHFLVRLRILHPVIAVLTAAFVIGGIAALRRRLPQQDAARRRLHWALVLAGTQVLLGFANIGLGAPGWMQIAHLLVAQLLWIAVVANRIALDPAQS